MLIRDVNQLSSACKVRCEAFLARCKDLRFDVAIVETKRLMRTQLAYYSKGREEEAYVDKLYILADLPKPSNYNIVTWTMDSKHLTGDAFDACPLDKNGKLWWNAPDQVWEAMAKIGEGVGLSAGRRFKTPDSPHFQVRA